MNIEGTYSLLERHVQKTDYEVFEGNSSYTYLQFEFFETREDKFTLKYIKFDLKQEHGERTGRIVDFKNKEQKSLQILLDSPISVKKSEHDSSETLIDWFYLYDKDKSISYISAPSKEILGTRKKLKKR